MSLNINKRDVLVVNRVWMALGVVTIKKAFEQLLSVSKDNGIVSKAFDFEYEYLGDDRWNFDTYISIRDLPFENWVLLPVRPFDSVIHTSKQSIRIPNVIMAVNCEKNHLREVKLSNRAILERDNYTCQYTGKQLPRHKLNIDHVIPKNRGGTDSWTNMVASDASLNSRKGNKLNSEAGLKLIREPKKPLPLPASALIREIKHREWAVFLNK